MVTGREGSPDSSSSAAASVTDGRRAELSGRLTDVRDRIHRACSAAGRNIDDVTLVVVTKTWPVADLRLLRALGVQDFGENRLQELQEKSVELADLDIRWHFVGQVQSNKAAKVARYADMVHSVDSDRVALKLDAGAHRFEREIDCLVQVSLDSEGAGGGRGGVSLDGIDSVANALAAGRWARLRGVMGVAPLGEDPSPAYARLREISRHLVSSHPSASCVSAGMSDDFEAALAAGATHVRVGSAVLGARPPLG